MTTNRPSSKRSTTSVTRTEVPTFPESLVVRQQDPERRLVVDRLADELAVARLEDVQRRQLAREDDDAEREEA